MASRASARLRRLSRIVRQFHTSLTKSSAWTLTVLRYLTDGNGWTDEPGNESPCHRGERVHRKAIHGDLSRPPGNGAAVFLLQGRSARGGPQGSDRRAHMHG